MPKRYSGEVYKKGAARYTEELARSGSVHEIHDMKEKPGFIGKKVGFYSVLYKNDFEKFKRHIIEESKIADSLIGEYLPEYYFTFLQNPSDPDDRKGNAAYYFMEDVKSLPKIDESSMLFSEAEETKRIEQLDALLERALDYYLKNFYIERGCGEALDIQSKNLIYGLTLKHPEPKLYLIDLHPLTVQITPLRFKVNLLSCMKRHPGKDWELEELFPKIYPRLEELDKLFEKK